MTDYWKSNDRKFCDFCKCWIADNKPSIAFHENGRRHKASVAKRISEISRNSIKAENSKRKMEQEIRKMEDAAMLSYASDISSKADITARTISVIAKESTNTSKPGVQVDPMLPPGDFSDDEEYNAKTSCLRDVHQEVPEGSMWVEGKSDEGYTYYWNVKTNASVWEPPKEGFMPLEEYNRINEIAVNQQKLQLEKKLKNYQETASEVVAKYNRERLKYFRRPDPEEIKRKEERELYVTEEQAQTPEIGEWQTVVKKEEIVIDFQLPKQNYYVPQVVTNIPVEPPVKKFREKVITSLKDDESDNLTSNTFKKRKIAGRSNARQRLDVD